MRLSSTPQNPSPGYSRTDGTLGTLSSGRPFGPASAGRARGLAYAAGHPAGGRAAEPDRIARHLGHGGREGAGASHRGGRGHGTAGRRRDPAGLSSAFGSPLAEPQLDPVTTAELYERGVEQHARGTVGPGGFPVEAVGGRDPAPRRVVLADPRRGGRGLLGGHGWERTAEMVG